MKQNNLDIGKALKILQPEGALSRTIKGFEPRIQQQEMMRNILAKRRLHLPSA